MAALDIGDFRPVTLDDGGPIKDHYERYPPFHSDYLLSTVLCWAHYMSYYYALVNGSLVLMTRQGDSVQFRPPVGPADPEVDRELMELAMAEGGERPLGMMDVNSTRRYGELFPDAVFEPDRDYYEYVYRSSDLVELGGKRYLKIRNVLNRFRRDFTYEAEPLGIENLDEVKAFLERWCLWRDCDGNALLMMEKGAVIYGMEHFVDLELSGLAIRIDGEIQAVSVFESMGNDTAVIHFEKANPDIGGLYQVVNRESARFLAEDHLYINRGSDMGIGGLRLAKERYGPHHMVEVYHLSRAQ